MRVPDALAETLAFGPFIRSEVEVTVADLAGDRRSRPPFPITLFGPQLSPSTHP